MDALLTQAAETGNLAYVVVHDPNLRGNTQHALTCFIIACRFGHLSVAQWIHATFKLPTAYVRANNCKALRWALSNGHLRVVQWLYDTFNLSAANIKADNNYFLILACYNSHQLVASWLVDTCGLKTEDLQVSIHQALRWAVKKGDLQKIKDITGTFAVSNVMIRGGDLLRCACANGQLDITKWLHITFGLTPADARSANNLALCMACSFGHLDTAAWLVKTFGLTAADIKNSHSAAHCVGKQLHVLQWLVETFNLDYADLSWPWSTALIDACLEGHLPTVKWLVWIFNPTAGDIGNSKDEAIRSGNRDVVCWFNNHQIRTHQHSRTRIADV